MPLQYLQPFRTNAILTGIFRKYFYPLARRKAPAEGRRPEGVGANIDRRLVPYHGKCKRIQSRIEFIYPLAGREAPAEGRRPEGEGANLDRHLVPYHVKQGESNLTSSLYIYLFIYMHQPRSSCASHRNFGPGK